MGLMTLNLARLGGLVTAISLVAARIDEGNFRPRATITKDVVILGGGASGAYAAVRLREDFKKSVLVVEKQDHLV
jgi:ribulose 1,5-bisphosphate synthetase/thiazole synthase